MGLERSESEHKSGEKEDLGKDLDGNSEAKETSQQEVSTLSPNHQTHSEPPTQSTHPYHLRKRRHPRSEGSSIIPVIPNSTQPPVPSKKSKLREENFRLKEKCKELQQQLDAAKTHAKLAALEVEEVQKRLNAKTSKKTTEPTFTAQTGWLGSRQGKEIAESNRQLRTAKQQKKDEAATRKVQEEADRQKRRQDIMLGVAVGFSGSIPSQKVGELQDIAYALGIQESGTKEALIGQIKTQFDENPALKNRPMFSGLFSSSRGHKRAVPDHNENENVEKPPSNRQRTETTSTMQPLLPFESAIAGSSRISHIPLASGDHPIKPIVHDHLLRFTTSSTYPQTFSTYPNNVYTFAQPNTYVNHEAIPSPHFYKNP